MRAKIAIISLVLAATIGSMSSAWALSCAPLEMNSSEIESTDVIIIGEVYDPNLDKNGRRKRVPNSSANAKSSSSNDAKADDAVKPFHVRVVWGFKGASDGDELVIYHDTTWDSGYTVGEQYLLGAQRVKVDEDSDDETQEKRLTVPLCGLNFHYPTYEQRTKQHYNFFGDEQLKNIKAYFAEKTGEQASEGDE